MKNPKSLTREQKECVRSHYLNPNKWSLVEEMEFYLKIINKDTGKIKFIDKFKKEKPIWKK